MAILEETSTGHLLHVYASPRASRTQLAGLFDGRLKIQVASPPVDGAANKVLIKFLASCLGVPKSKIELKSGHTGKRKCFFIEGIQDIDAARRALGLQTI